MEQKQAKSKKPLKLYVSKKALIRLRQSLIETPPNFNFTEDYFLYYLDVFYRLETNNKELWYKEDSDYMAISCNYFKSVIDNKTYRKHLKYLKDIGVVLIDEKFKNNESKGYKYNPIYESNITIVEIQPESILWQKMISNSNKKRSHKAKQPHLKLMEKEFDKLRFDIPLATEFLDRLLEQGFITQNQYNVRLVALNRINTRDIFFGRNSTNNRLDSSLSNLKKELKNFIVGDYVCLDLKNSQPFLLNSLLNYYISTTNTFSSSFYFLQSLSYCGENCNTNPLNSLLDKLLRRIEKRPILNLKEIELWHKHTKQGGIYELFMERLNIDRDIAKELFLCVLYSPNNSKNYRAEKKLFKKVFPTIYKLFYRIKIKKYEDLAITMQKVESYIFIDLIARELVEAGIIPYTVHDSVIVKKEHQTKVKEIIDGMFLRHFPELPSFELTELSPSSDEIYKALLFKPREKVKKRKNKKKEWTIETEIEYQNYLRETREKMDADSDEYYQTQEYRLELLSLTN